MIRNLRWLTGLLALVAFALPPAAAQARTLGVEVWTDRGDDAVYQPGDAMQVKVRASDDAYLLVYEIDSNGKISVLYPWRRGSNLVEARHTYRLPPEDSNYELAVEKATGEGYIVAVASRRPFRDLPWYLRTFDPQGESMGYEDRHDDEEGFDKDGNVVGDPMVAMERIRRRILDRPGDTDDFATSYASYYVGHEVRYPRYLCADCHRPDQWAWWDGYDPYYARCAVFDFRVNWNWCWGPCIWAGDVPYYFYVVRPDCPPRYRGWYENHSRWSSWDGSRRWNTLWGGSLVRYKSAAPAGYVGPPAAGRPVTYRTGEQPPGFLPSSGAMRSRTGFREPLPVGRSIAAQPPERTGGPASPEAPRGVGEGRLAPGERPEVRPQQPAQPQQPSTSGQHFRQGHRQARPQSTRGGSRSGGSRSSGHARSAAQRGGGHR